MHGRPVPSTVQAILKHTYYRSMILICSSWEYLQRSDDLTIPMLIITQLGGGPLKVQEMCRFLSD